jgi:phage baseplate assembly protein W
MSKAEVNVISASDLKLAEFLLGSDFQINKNGDIEIISGEMNIAQAILHRIRTAKGELAELGHPEYGSRILDFVGQQNNWLTRQRLKIAIRDTLLQEPRIKQIVSINVNPRVGVTSDSSGKTQSVRSAEVLGNSVSPVQDGEQIGSEFQESPTVQLLAGSGELVNTMDVDIVIIPVGSTEPIQMGFPFNLEGD